MTLSIQTITEILQSNAALIKCPGLIYGKMGLVVYFFHYSKYSNDRSYAKFAIKLIEGIQDSITEDSQINYSRGLSGIGSGIEYLAQQGFLNINTDEVLKDIDAQVFRSIVYAEFIDSSLFNGLTGLGRYLMFRVTNTKSTDDKVSTLTNKMLIIHVVDKLEKMLIRGDELTEDSLKFLIEVRKLNIYPTKINKIIDNYRRHSCVVDCQFKESNNHSNIEIIRANSNKWESSKSNFSLYNGYVGFGLSILTQLDCKHQTWRTLL